MRNDGTIITPQGITVVSISRRGVETVMAGTGQAGFSGDDGPATQARLRRHPTRRRGPLWLLEQPGVGGDLLYPGIH